jgi:hypothetical protein
MKNRLFHAIPDPIPEDLGPTRPCSRKLARYTSAYHGIQALRPNLSDLAIVSETTAGADDWLCPLTVQEGNPELLGAVQARQPWRASDKGLLPTSLEKISSCLTRPDSSYAAKAKLGSRVAGPDPGAVGDSDGALAGECGTVRRPIWPLRRFLGSTARSPAAPAAAASAVRRPAPRH